MVEGEVEGKKKRDRERTSIKCSLREKGGKCKKKTAEEEGYKKKSQQKSTTS